MKVLIVGCGKFGVRVSEQLTRKNHDVTVVDTDPEAFLALGEEFTGRTICGVGYDRDVLEQAGVATMDVVISCANSDALNAVVANIAKNIYHVPTVIARMYDPTRAKLFESMGIYTVSITRLGLDNVMEYLEQNRSWRVVRKFAGEDLQLIQVRVPFMLEGTPFGELSIPGKLRLIAMERQGNSMLPEDEDTCAYGDVLYFTVKRDALAEARDLLQL